MFCGGERGSVQCIEQLIAGRECELEKPRGVDVAIASEFVAHDVAESGTLVVSQREGRGGALCEEGAVERDGCEGGGG